MRPSASRRRGLVLALIGGLLPSAACSLVPGAGEGGERAPAEQRDGKGRAAPTEGVMCAEHGVLEALCTRCNPRLAAVFQARGDWCAEHALPESICPICHPERGGKPVVDVAQDGAPADGTKVRLKDAATVVAAGIETVKAELREGAGGVSTTAHLDYDATRLAHLNARSPGVVRALAADVGSRVAAGDPLVVIDSPEVGADRARLETARARVAIAEQNFQRQLALAPDGIASQKSVLAARQELDDAKGARAALAASLSVLGTPGRGAGGYTLTAPIAGVVTQRNATIGRLVSAEQILYEIVDTSAMWAELDVPEIDLPLVAAGQRVQLTLDGLPGRTFSGAITYVAPWLDPHTRTARARVPLENPDGLLRANMYGEARITAEARQAVLVPRMAIQRAKDVRLAFVRLSAHEFETRRVEIGISDGQRVEVKRGLRAGEEVVTQGSFLLKTETLKGSIGAGCCEAD
ncbi:efflux RND transporter periplasmic adaptor subunit [Chondromyces crocatus]|uniref:RND transporter n=1 Tax=Chondromyces crocatus TaxID=52 RepID=A0A0K1ENY9_CHOCO|nr:efflux RND transporter periplasmic adaptor subunit [Chondromyces crocatus]AKT42372.1 RND transporter [Chondromyces crocatus]